MKQLCFLLLVVFCAGMSTLSIAQDALPPVEVVPERPALPDGVRCFVLNNKAPYTVIGAVITNYYLTNSGAAARQNSNFRLEENESTELCSYGPFYGPDNNRLKLVIRTLIPVFSCEFTAEGELNIYGRKKPEGGTKTWANCL